MLTILVTLFLGFYQIFFGNPLKSKIDQFLKEQNFQGAILIAQGDRVFHCKGYGEANREHAIPNTPDTVFRIASLSKQFTAVAIMQLQEQGILSVHDRVSRYLPSFPHGDAITLHHLLTHTSGLAEITDFPNLAELQRHPTSPKQIITYIKDLPLEFTPGTQCIYSNTGYIVLGAIIEAVTHIPYEHYIQEHLLIPLRLNATYYDHYQSVIPNRATGYRIDKQAPFIDMTFPHGAGGLVSTVKNLFTWNRALYSRLLISEESLATVLSVHAADPEGKLTYGYGLCIGPQNEDFGAVNSPIIGHIGEIEGFRAALIYYPMSDLTIIVLSNDEAANIVDLHTTLARILISYWR